VSENESGDENPSTEKDAHPPASSVDSVGEYYSEYSVSQQEVGESQSESSSSDSSDSNNEPSSSSEAQSSSDNEPSSSNSDSEPTSEGSASVQSSSESTSEYSSSVSVDYPRPDSLEESTPEEVSAWTGDDSDSVADTVVHIPASDSSSSESAGGNTGDVQSSTSESDSDAAAPQSVEGGSNWSSSESEGSNGNEDQTEDSNAQSNEESNDSHPDSHEDSSYEHEHEETSDEIYSDGMNFKGLGESSAEPSSEWQQSETELSEQVINIPAEDTSSEDAPALALLQEDPSEIDMATIEAEALPDPGWAKDLLEDSFISIHTNSQYQKIHQRRAEKMFMNQRKT
jgi:hypothetical protein